MKTRMSVFVRYVVSKLETINDHFGASLNNCVIENKTGIESNTTNNTPIKRNGVSFHLIFFISSQLLPSVQTHVHEIHQVEISLMFDV